MSFSASSAAWLAMVGVAAASVGPPRVLVWPESGGESSVDATAVETAGFEPVDYAADVEAERTAVREETRKELDTVRAELEQAQSLYLEQDYVQMGQVLAATEQRALSLLALPGTCDTLWELEFRRGLAAFGDSDAETTQARFRLAASLRPERRPDASYYGPDVAQAFAEAVQAERAAVKSPLGVAVTPNDATRFVDCVPLEGLEIELSLGLHVVWAVAPGHVPHAEVVDVAEASTARATLTSDTRRGASALAALPSEVPVRFADASARTVVWQVLEEQDADALVWLRQDNSSWEAQLHVHDTRGKLHRESTRRAAVTAALAELGPDGRVVIVAPVVQPAPAPEPEVEPKRPLARKWWFWTIIGGVALTAVAVGLAVGLPRTTAAGPSRQTITVE